MSLALPEEMGVDLDSVDFLLGGSSLNIMATKRIEAGDKYLWLVNACDIFRVRSGSKRNS